MLQQVTVWWLPAERDLKADGLDGKCTAMHPGHAGGILPYHSGVGVVCLLFSQLHCTSVLTHASLPLSLFLFPRPLLLPTAQPGPWVPLLLSSLFHPSDCPCLYSLHPWSYSLDSVCSWMLITASALINVLYKSKYTSTKVLVEWLNNVWNAFETHCLKVQKLLSFRHD